MCGHQLYDMEYFTESALECYEVDKSIPLFSRGDQTSGKLNYLEKKITYPC